MQYTQLDMFPTTVHLRSIDASQNKWRFYRLSVQPNLFGEWGRIGRYGRVKRQVFASAGSALDALQELAIKKQRRGYFA